MENNNTVQNVVHGFKVFRPDWTCSPNGNTKQYTCPGKFEEEGELDVCGHGMHFCQTAERKSSRQCQTLMLKYSSSVRVSG